MTSPKEEQLIAELRMVMKEIRMRGAEWADAVWAFREFKRDPQLINQRRHSWEGCPFKAEEKHIEILRDQVKIAEVRLLAVMGDERQLISLILAIREEVNHATN